MYYDDSSDSCGIEFGEGSEMTREKSERVGGKKSVGGDYDLNILGGDLAKCK